MKELAKDACIALPIFAAGAAAWWLTGAPLVRSPQLAAGFALCAVLSAMFIASRRGL